MRWECVRVLLNCEIERKRELVDEFFFLDSKTDLVSAGDRRSSILVAGYRESRRGEDRVVN